MATQKAIAGRALVIPLTINVPVGDLLVPVSKDGKHVKDAEIKVKGENQYEISFTPPDAGVYKMEICVKGILRNA